MSKPSIESRIRVGVERALEPVLRGSRAHQIRLLTIAEHYIRAKRAELELLEARSGRRGGRE